MNLTIGLPLLAFLVGVLSNCASTVNRHPPTDPKPYTIGDMEIALNGSEGELILKGLKIASVSKFWRPKLVGSVTNNTQRDWKNIIFELVVPGHGGKPIFFTILELPKGKTKAIGPVGRGQYLSGLRSGNLEGTSVRYVDGEYLSHYRFTLTKPTPSESLTFRDRLLDIQFAISKEHLGFALHNTTEESLIIDWNQVVYVDVKGKSHKVIPSGMKDTDKRNSQIPSIVPPNTKIKEIIAPSSYIYYISGEYGGWYDRPLFPDGPKSAFYRNRSFSLLMPLRVNGTTYDYNFTFKIQNVES